MRLLDSNRFSVRVWLVFADEQIAEPGARLLPFKTRLTVSDPEVVGIADTLFEPVVLIVADAFILRLELDGSVENRAGGIAFRGVEPTVGENDQIPVFRWPKI